MICEKTFGDKTRADVWHHSAESVDARSLPWQHTPCPFLCVSSVYRQNRTRLQCPLLFHRCLKTGMCFCGAATIQKHTYLLNECFKYRVLAHRDIIWIQYVLQLVCGTSGNDLSINLHISLSSVPRHQQPSLKIHQPYIWEHFVLVTFFAAASITKKTVKTLSEVPGSPPICCGQCFMNSKVYTKT